MELGHPGEQRKLLLARQNIGNGGTEGKARGWFVNPVILSVPWIYLTSLVAIDKAITFLAEGQDGAMKWRGLAEEIGFCVGEKIVEEQLNAALIRSSAIFRHQFTETHKGPLNITDNTDENMFARRRSD
jgi:hypothetical protein